MADLATAKHLLDRRKTPYNTCLANWRFSSPHSVLWLIKVWFFASTFVLKIATLAKPENVRHYFKTTIKDEKERNNIIDFDTAFNFSICSIQLQGLFRK